MNRTLILLAAAAATPLAFAQAPAASAPAAAVSPKAVDAKIALINFEQVVLASNEGQVVTLNTQKKYEPKKAEIERLAAEVDSLKKSLQGAGTTLSDADRASKLRDIDTREKHLNQDAQEAQEQYNADLQESLGKVAQKLATTMKSYSQQQGFTILLDVSSQQSNVLWALPSTDISQAVVEAYNKESGIAAPAPQAPSAARPSTAPRSSTPAKPAGH